MKRVLTGVLGAALAYITVAQASAQETAMVGFKEASAQAQRDLEERYDSHLNVDNLRRWMKQMTGRPHHAGSPKAKENAEFIAESFKEWGYETESLSTVGSVSFASKRSGSRSTSSRTL